MKRLLSSAILFLALCGCSFTTKCGDSQDTSCTRALFIGNSYTFFNDLPSIFAELARSGGNKVEAGMSAQSGWTLSNHLRSTDIFFATWAHRYGCPETGMDDYESMQAQINYGYMEIAQELNAPIAPVGAAWQAAVQRYPDLILWQVDGSHPTEQGTYLAACVFYAVIFHESPNELVYRAALSRENARIIQSIASSTVLNIP